ncbi:MAG TPA: UDP-N-acetylmuramate dehydrogenase [Thermoleophilia bacterium]|nr:UDP-N-acetylmuramate dehydrogenase [Thermoleophilia bacterium]
MNDRRGAGLPPMLSKETTDILQRELPGVRHGEGLARYCAYAVGGPAELLYEATTTARLRRAVVVAHELGVPLTVLGLGTNILVSERGVSGLVVLARNNEQHLDHELLRVGAGASTVAVIAGLAGRGLAGLEFAGNIPGSFGGAVVGNAGAYGRSIADVLAECTLMENGRESRATPAELGFDYRTSVLKRGSRAVVLQATFALQRGVSSDLLQEIARDAELRRSKHPLEWASCGSYFKNPSRDVPAARLIEETGLKGFTVGRAQVSEKHANFLVALPGATADDIRALGEAIKSRVFEHCGVRLVEEVTLLGFD